MKYIYIHSAFIVIIVILDIVIILQYTLLYLLNIYRTSYNQPLYCNVTIILQLGILYELHKQLSADILSSFMDFLLLVSPKA